MAATPAVGICRVKRGGQGENRLVGGAFEEMAVKVDGDGEHGVAQGLALGGDPVLSGPCWLRVWTTVGSPDAGDPGTS